MIVKTQNASKLAHALEEIYSRAKGSVLTIADLVRLLKKLTFMPKAR